MSVSPPPKEHVVRPGESLATIAAKYGLASWKALYDAPCNADLRRRRGNPRLIQPGDKVLVPPDARQVAQARLAHLRRLKAETEKTFTRLQQQLAAEYRKVMNVGTIVDTAGTLALLAVNIGGFVKDAHKATKLAGDELAKANAELLKTHVQGHAERMVEIGDKAGLFEVQANDGLLWAFGKVLVHSWFEMTSPSYWAARITQLQTGQTPEQAFQEAQRQLETTKLQVLTRLNARIRETEALLQQANLPAPPMH